MLKKGSTIIVSDKNFIKVLDRDMCSNRELRDWITKNDCPVSVTDSIQIQPPKETK